MLGLFNKIARPISPGLVCVKRNIPVATVANSIGVSRQTIYNWFTGASDPQNIVVAAIKQFLASFTK